MCPRGSPDGKPLCIDRSQICDGKSDCEDKADEEATCCKCYISFIGVVGNIYQILREARKLEHMVT